MRGACPTGLLGRLRREASHRLQFPRVLQKLSHIESYVLSRLQSSVVCGILRTGTPTIANTHSSISSVLHLSDEEGSEKHQKHRKTPRRVLMSLCGHLTCILRSAGDRSAHWRCGTDPRTWGQMFLKPKCTHTVKMGSEQSIVAV